MFHFPRFPPRSYVLAPRWPDITPAQVSQFGHPRIKACLRLPEAFRRLPRPS